MHPPSPENLATRKHRRHLLCLLPPLLKPLLLSLLTIQLLKHLPSFLLNIPFLSSISYPIASHIHSLHSFCARFLPHFLTGILTYHALQYHANYLTILPNGLSIHRGIFKPVNMHIPFNSILHIHLNTSPIEHLLKSGTLTLITSLYHQPIQLKLSSLPNAHSLYTLLQTFLTNPSTSFLH